MLQQEITISLSDADGQLSADTLAKALNGLLDYFRSIEASLVGSDTTVVWHVIKITKNSPAKITFAPTVRVRGRSRPAIGRKIVKETYRYAVGLERGTNLPAINDDTLEAAKKVIKSTKTDGTQVTFVTTSKDAEGAKSSEKITWTEKAVQHIDEISARARLYMDFTSVEGVLDVVSVRGQQAFQITETLTGHRIECTGSEEHFEKAKLLLGRRVSVTGRVSYRNHVPRSIHVEEEIRPLREAKDLPQPSNIGPIDITGGLSSEEYIRRIRNA